MKRDITVISPSGAHVPGLGRLGKGVHKDVELTADQLTALKADPGAEISTASAKKTQEA